MRVSSFLLLLLLSLALPAMAQRHFHIDSASGSDDAAGTRASPWKTLERAARQSLQPGDRLLLARGTAYVGVLPVRDSGTAAAPIVIGAYGSGKAPRLSNPFFSVSSGRIIDIAGSHVVVENLYLFDTPTPPPDDPPLRWQDSPQHKKVSEMGAVFVHQGASNVVIRNNEFVNTAMGIRLRGSHSKVERNYLHDAAKITEQWGAIAINIVGPHNEVAYNLVENYGFYGGTYVNDGAAVELDGEDPTYDAHHIRIHHNVSRNVKGGFIEIAGKSNDVLIDHNVSDDVDKFVGASNVKNIEIRNNTVIRMRLPSFPAADFFPLGTVFWTFNDKGDDEFIVADNVFYLDAKQRLYKSAEHKLGITPLKRERNLYFTPNGDITTMLGQQRDASETVANPGFVNLAKGDYRMRKTTGTGYQGAYPPGQPMWKAGL